MYTAVWACSDFRLSITAYGLNRGGITGMADMKNISGEGGCLEKDHSVSYIIPNIRIELLKNFTEVPQKPLQQSFKNKSGTAQVGAISKAQK